MSFREITMQDVREVLRRREAGQSARRIAREKGLDRKTVGRYLEQANDQCVERDTAVTDEIAGAVGKAVQAVASEARNLEARLANAEWLAVGAFSAADIVVFRRPDIVEGTVGKRRPTVAFHAMRLADKQIESALGRDPIACVVHEDVAHRQRC